MGAIGPMGLGPALAYTNVSPLPACVSNGCREAENDVKRNARNTTDFNSARFFFFFFFFFSVQFSNNITSNK